jgi:hypothetical protein
VAPPNASVIAAHAEGDTIWVLVKAAAGSGGKLLAFSKSAGGQELGAAALLEAGGLSGVSGISASSSTDSMMLVSAARTAPAVPCCFQSCSVLAGQSIDQARVDRPYVLTVMLLFPTLPAGSVGGRAGGWQHHARCGSPLCSELISCGHSSGGAGAGPHPDPHHAVPRIAA